jgi:hypothetical protein
MAVMTTADEAQAAADAQTRAALARQSGALWGTLVRLRAAQTSFLPSPTTTHWKGDAQRSQSLAVSSLAEVVENACAAIERARTLTSSAIATLDSRG